MDQNNKIFGLTYAQALAAFAAVLGIIGMFLPWWSFSAYGFSTSVGGGGRSALTGLLCIIVLAIIFSDKIVSMVSQSSGGSSTTNQLSSLNNMVKSFSNIILLIIGLIILVVALDSFGALGSYQGIGLWLTIIAGLGIIGSVAINLLIFKAPLMPSNAAGQIQKAFNQPPPAPQQAPPAYSPPPVTPAPQNAQPANPGPTAQTAQVMPKICPYCSAPLTGEKFCGNCGNKVN